MRKEENWTTRKKREREKETHRDWKQEREGERQPLPQGFVSAEDAGVPADDVQEDVERAQPAGLCSAAGGDFFLSLF